MMLLGGPGFQGPPRPFFEHVVGDPRSHAGGPFLLSARKQSEHQTNNLKVNQQLNARKVLPGIMKFTAMPSWPLFVQVQGLSLRFAKIGVCVALLIGSFISGSTPVAVVATCAVAAISPVASRTAGPDRIRLNPTIPNPTNPNPTIPRSPIPLSTVPRSPVWSSGRLSIYFFSGPIMPQTLNLCSSGNII